jgi:DNA-directed RNA polymerase subunit L
VNRIGEVFTHTFAHWQITLPAGSIEAHQRGEIRAAGWTIRYLFGEDENGEYLDYYASHRMTNDRHVRIYANGSVEQLEAIQEFMVFPAGSTKEQEKEIEKKYFEENQRIHAELVKKGFLKE